MNYPLGQHPGTVWHRSDLQMHTPRDHGWAGVEITAPDQGSLADERLKWAKTLVSHCLQAEPPITAIAITDHHDYCIAEQVREAADGSDLTVFPGVEITCSDNAQCIVLFDPKAAPGLVEKLIQSLPGVPPSNMDSCRGPSIAHANLTVLDLAQTIEKNPQFRGECLLLPHFGDGDAHKTLNVPSNAARFAALNAEGVYIEKAHSDLAPGTLDKLRGKVTEWGPRRRGVIATGDNKSETFERVGKHPCWLKLGEASIEGLRQALLADEARISYASPDEPTERIVEMEVLSNLTGDAPLVVTFNAGFNALVGGRGTGKSALLEYLRFGLGRTERDIPGSDTANETSRESRLIEDTLTGGYVRLILNREGVQESWRRDLSTSDYIDVEDGSGNASRLTLDAARERFRARAFRQKGLSSLTSDPASTSDQITGIAAAEALARRREIDRSIMNSRRAVSTSLQQIVAHWQASLDVQQARDRVTDLTERLRSINAILALGGVSEEHLQVIEKAGLHSRANAYLKLVADVAEREGQAIPSESHLAAALPESINTGEFAHLSILEQKVASVREQITELYGRARALIDELVDQQKLATIAQIAVDAELSEKMSDAEAAQTAQKALIEDSKRLGNDLADAEQSLGRALSRQQETQAYEVSFRRAQRELQDLLASRRTVLEEAASQVAGKSSGLLKARLGRDKTLSQYVAALVRLTEGSYISDAGQKCADWVRGSVQSEPSAWSKIAANLKTLYQSKIAAGSPTEPGGEILALIRGMFFPNAPVTERQATKIYTNLTDSTLAEVLSAVPQDGIVMTYVDGSGKEMAFGTASPGQKASAVLELLLRQSAGTLLIDQPEDDLDNRVIMKIVDLIRTSKANRQLIFTTHNPNVVVNGDADKVVALSTREPQQGGRHNGAMVSLQVDGAIETEAVRGYITALIEGGKEAFDLRGRKYGY